MHFEPNRFACDIHFIQFRPFTLVESINVFVFFSLLFPQHKIATGGALAAGAALAWSSPTQTLIVEEHLGYDFPITKDDFSWIGSLVTLGAAAVCLVIGTVIQILGRKLTMLLLVIPFTIGWALVTFATNLAMLMVGRFLLGVAGGAFCVAAPTYTGEIAQSSIRGTLGSYFQLMMVIGILFVYCIGSYVSVFALNLISAVIPLVFGAIFVFMPESPTYLIAKGKKEEAAKALKWLRGSKYDFSQELAELQAQHEEDQKNKVSVVAAFGRRATQKAMFISLGLMFFQQMSGVNAVIFFTTGIFKSTGASIDPSIATIIVGVMQVISVFVSSIIVDKAGRRLLLLPSALAMCITTALLGTYFFMKHKNADSVASLGWLPIASLCGFIILFSIGFGTYFFWIFSIFIHLHLHMCNKLNTANDVPFCFFFFNPLYRTHSMDDDGRTIFK